MIAIAALAVLMRLLGWAAQNDDSSGFPREPCFFIDVNPNQPTGRGSGTLILSESVGIPLMSNFVPLALTVTLPALAFYCWSRRQRRVQSSAANDPKCQPIANSGTVWSGEAERV